MPRPSYFFKMTGGLFSGILGRNIGASPLACSGQNTKMQVYFDKSHVIQSDIPGFAKHQVHIPGSVLCDASGVIHAGALRVHKIDISDNLTHGVVALKEPGCPLPSVCRTTFVTPSGNIAGMHVTGNNCTSTVDLCQNIAGMIPGCAYAAPVSDSEHIQKTDHLTCKWAGRIGTDMDNIASSCIDLSDQTEPMFGIPLCAMPDKPVCCLSKFATDLYASNNISKVKACFGPTAEVVRGANGLPMLRIRGSAGLEKVNAAKRQLCTNMTPAFMHHGVDVAVFTPKCVKFRPGTVQLLLHRDVSAGAVTQQMVGEKLNITINNPNTVLSSPDTIAADLASALVIPSGDATSAIAQATVSVYPAANGSTC